MTGSVNKSKHGQTGRTCTFLPKFNRVPSPPPQSCIYICTYEKVNLAYPSQIFFSHSERYWVEKSLPLEASAPALTQPQPLQLPPSILSPPFPLLPLSFPGSVLAFSPSPGLVLSWTPRHHHYGRAWRDGWSIQRANQAFCLCLCREWGGGRWWEDSPLWLWNSSSWCRERREREREAKTQGGGGGGEEMEEKEMSASV